MNKKVIIGLLVVTGLLVGYYYFNNKQSTATKKDYNDKSLATQKDGLDFYTKLSAEGNWAYSDEGIGRFIKLYSENVTKGTHNQIMDILNGTKEKRSANQNQLVEDTFDSVVEKIK
jgi:hypothetical protein